MLPYSVIADCVRQSYFQNLRLSGCWHLVAPGSASTQLFIAGWKASAYKSKIFVLGSAAKAAHRVTFRKRAMSRYTGSPRHGRQSAAMHTSNLCVVREKSSLDCSPAKTSCFNSKMKDSPRAFRGRGAVAIAHGDQLQLHRNSPGITADDAGHYELDQQQLTALPQSDSTTDGGLCSSSSPGSRSITSPPELKFLSLVAESSGVRDAAASHTPDEVSGNISRPDSGHEGPWQHCSAAQDPCTACTSPAVAMQATAGACSMAMPQQQQQYRSTQQWIPRTMPHVPQLVMQAACSSKETLPVQLPASPASSQRDGKKQGARAAAVLLSSGECTPECQSPVSQMPQAHYASQVAALQAAFVQSQLC